MRAVAVLAAVAVFAPAQEKIDLDAIYKIKQEALQNSKVMDYLFWLTDVYGPRLAGSPRYKTGAEWVVKTLKEAGIENAKLEKWGTFGKGWENKKFVAAMTEPAYMPLIGLVQAWTASTDGVVSGEAVYAALRTQEDLDKWKGKLAGKIVFTDPPGNIALHEKPEGHRYTDQELTEISLAPTPGLMFGNRAMPAGPQQNFQQQMAFRQKLNAFLRDEKAAVLVSTSARADFGTAFNSNGGSRAADAPPTPAMISLTGEHYNRIARMLEKNIPVKLEIEIKNEFYPADENNFNVVGDIPGTGKHKDEIVMIGGHLDTWHAATGATDNGAGTAVMMETMRILKKLGFKMDRTVRIGLWDAEEQGLLGSRGYVKEHFADRTTMKTTSEYDKLSAYYNIDNGGGKIRGIYLQGNEMCRPIFDAFLAPFKDLGVTTITIRNTGGTDHQSFDGVGLPGFQFIQDPLEYDTRTHHTNMDVYDRIPRGDMMQMVAVVSSMVYHTANREQMLPRKPKPEAGGGGRGPF